MKQKLKFITENICHFPFVLFDTQISKGSQFWSFFPCEIGHSRPMWPLPFRLACASPIISPETAIAGERLQVDRGEGRAFWRTLLTFDSHGHIGHPSAGRKYALWLLWLAAAGCGNPFLAWLRLPEFYRRMFQCPTGAKSFPFTWMWLCKFKQPSKWLYLCMQRIRETGSSDDTPSWYWCNDWASGLNHATDPVATP